VDAMVSSGVGRYLEFRSMDALCVFESTSTETGAGAAAVEPGKAEPTYRYWRVPCSKKDIFTSKALSREEKHKLMKFLRFCMDWGKQMVARKQVSDQDDSELTMGRALNRPQNASVVSAPVSPAEYVEQNKPFSAFLDAWGLPERLRYAVLHAIAMIPTPADRITEISTADGLESLHRHLQALGQFGETAFLAPLYGGAELAQAFCRLCAVRGGTYILRRSLWALALDQDSQRVIGVVDHAGTLIRCKHVVCCEEYLADLLPSYKVSDSTSKEATRSLVHAASVPTASSRGLHSKTWTVRRICVVSGPLFDATERLVTVLNPHTAGVHNPAPVFVVQTDDSANCCPSNMNASVLHVTMTWEVDFSETGTGDRDQFVRESLVQAGTVLANATRVLTQTAGSQELWHLGFAVPVSHDNERKASAPSLPTNVHVCSREVASLDPFTSIRQAKRIFGLCAPGKDFLVQTEEDLAAQAQMRGEAEDEDQAALEAALKAAEEAERALEQLGERLSTLEARDQNTDRRITSIEQRLSCLLHQMEIRS